MTQIHFSAADEYFCASRKFNGDGAVPTLWQPRDVVACTPALSHFMPSLFIAFIIRDVIQLFSLVASRLAFSSSFFYSPCEKTTADDKVYYKICALCSLSPRLYSYSGQSEKRNSSPDDKSSDWSMNASAILFQSFCSQFFIFLRFFRALGLINIWNSIEFILIYNYIFIALL